MFIGRVGEYRYNRHKDLLDNARKMRKDNAAPARVTAAPAPVRLSQHRACLDPALRWRCAVCLVTPNTVKALARTPCVSNAERAPARVHSLRQFREFVFCKELCQITVPCSSPDLLLKFPNRTYISRARKRAGACICSCVR